MTERPHSQGARSVHVRFVGGHREPLAARNQAEIDAALSVAREAIAMSERGGPVKTIGLLSPYRDQTNALAQGVVIEFTPEQITRHEIVCGTAHSLQGDERDIVVLSTVIDANYNPNSLRFLEDPNLFNVAITRAAEQLIVVTSVTITDLPSGAEHYLSKFLRHAETVTDPETRTDVFRSEFEREVCDALRARGHRVTTNYPSCGYEIDLVATDGTSSVAVECDGHPSHFRADGSYSTEDLQRQAVLSRAGWVIHRIPLSSWRRDPTRHLDRIAHLLSQPEPPRERTPPTLPAPLPQARPAVPATAASPRKPVTARQPPRKRVAKPSGRRVPVSGTRCKCGGRWVLRTGRYGKFYGCSRYPRCRNTRSFP
jgi:very-short-patch-repair endonuclease